MVKIEYPVLFNRLDPIGLAIFRLLDKRFGPCRAVSLLRADAGAKERPYLFLPILSTEICT